MEASPFEFQGPVPPEHLRGREALLDDLVERVTHRRVTALLGPRRFGKTSVLRRLSHELTALATVWVDFYGVASLADVAARFDDALAAAPDPFVGEARGVAAAVQVNLGVVRAEFARPRRAQPDASARLGQLLKVFVQTAKRSPALLIIDEFASVAGARGAQEMLRTEFQHHYRDFGLILSGSQVSTMRQLFGDREQPFYGQADLVTIPPLAAETVDELVREGFERTGRRPGRVAALIHDLARGHPQRTMLLADAVWRHTAPGEDADDRWGEALAEVRTQVDGWMRTLHDGLASGEQRVLRVLADGGSLFGAAAAQVRLTAGTASNARKQLIAKGHLHEDGETLVDPLFADWFRQTLPLH